MRTLIIFLVLGCLASVAMAVGHSVVIYSENFEGGSDGQSVTDPPFNWTPADPTETLHVTSSTVFGGLAIDGSTLSKDGVPYEDGNYFSHPIPAITALTEEYTLTALAYASGTNNSGIGFSALNAMFYNHWPGGGSWVLDLRHLIVGSSVFYLGGNGELTNEIVQITLSYDLVNYEVTGTVQGSSTLSVTVPFAPGLEANILPQVLVFQDTRPHDDVTLNLGMDIDNIVVTEVIPEPATIALLGLGGLALIRRKR